MLDNPFNKLYSRKSTTVPKIPLYLDIELTNHCNLKCKMCGTNYSKRKKGFMSKRTFGKVAEFALKNNIPVRFIGWGEPTLHPWYKGWMELFPICHVNTNGYKELPLVNSIKVSLHGQVIRILNIANSKIISATTTDLEKVKKEQIAFFRAKTNKTDTRWIDGKNRSNKRFKRCGEVFDKLTIFWNGDISACCGDVEGKLILGNINKDDILDIWRNSKQLNYMRKELRKKNWNCTELCKICYDYT